MKKIIMALALAGFLGSAPAYAGGGGDAFSGLSVGGFGGFATAGRTGAVSAFGGEAEAYAGSGAGVVVNRWGGEFHGWQDGQSGARTEGNAAAFGATEGFAAGNFGFRSRLRGFGGTN